MSDPADITSALLRYVPQEVLAAPVGADVVRALKLRERVPPRPSDVPGDVEEPVGIRVQRLAGTLPPKIARELCDGTFERTELTEAVDAWVDGGPRGLLLRGGFGAGKSLHAGYALVRATRGLAAGESSWHRPRGFISGMLHDYDAKAPRVGRAIVVVDDVGRYQRGVEDLEEALCALIDERDTRFILTSNAKRDEMRELFRGGALTSRLCDCAWAIDVPDSSWRQTVGDF